MTTLLLLAATVLVGVVTGLAVRRWAVSPARVESSSMEPTLRSGQRLVVRRLRPAERVARGDVVLVRSPELGRVVVKRAVGLAGERIVLGLDGGVRVDGQLLSEPYARPERRSASGSAILPTLTYTVPQGTLFLLGDNRTASIDSRSWRRPFVPEDAVIGKVVRLGRGGRQ